MASPFRRLAAGLPTTALLILLALPPNVVAHGGINAGPYELELGWRSEPAVVGQSNAVRVTITELATGQPVTDLAAGDLVVTIATAGHDSATLLLAPAFDAASGGVPVGAYEAAFVPDAAGLYTFHVAGSIHGTDVDGILENSVDADTSAVELEPGPDPVVFVVGGMVLALLAGMGFLLFRVRSVPAAATARAPVPSKRHPPRRPQGR